MTENHILLHFLLPVVRTHFGKLVVILYGNVFYSPEVIIISWLNRQADIREALALLIEAPTRFELSLVTSFKPFADRSLYKSNLFCVYLPMLMCVFTACYATPT